MAIKGQRDVAPNPMVGCVIVYDGKVIGEGYHRKHGGAHAEVNAIESVHDSSLLSGSVLYVNLEPCNHEGKTPPCVNEIIKHKIPEVIIGTSDPHLAMKDNGIKHLREAGVNVTEAVMKEACEELNRRFFTFHTQKRP